MNNIWVSPISTGEWITMQNCLRLCWVTQLYIVLSFAYTRGNICCRTTDLCICFFVYRLYCTINPVEKIQFGPERCMILVMFTVYLQYLKHSCDAYKNNVYNFQLTTVKGH